ncbi:hypothetical protein Tco_0644898 [Tanacetum coccineum]
MHMLTKPQVFYDDTHKQAIGYQNPFYLKKAQRIKPILYDGSVISSQHAVIPVIDDEETLILEEEFIEKNWFVGEGVMVTSSSLEMLRNSYLRGIMVSFVFLEGLEEEALVEFMVELFEEDEYGKKNEKDGLFDLKANDQSGKA